MALTCKNSTEPVLQSPYPWVEKVLSVLFLTTAVSDPKKGKIGKQI